MRLAVLGDPVDHSLSPLLHEAALAATGIAGTYVARRVDAAGMAEAVEELRSGRLDGANVTMPHKQLAAQLADDLAGPARRIRAVNTLVRVGGDVFGHNTDVAGVLHAWRWAALPEEAPVLILGAGGAAAAALAALEGRAITLAARRPVAASALRAKLDVNAAIVPLGTPVSGAVVVNATPVGMQGEALPAEVLEVAAGLFDMAYGSFETPAVAVARRAGLPCADGPSMLLGQAVESFRLWTGRSPVAAMRDALETARRIVARAPA